MAGAAEAGRQKVAQRIADTVAECGVSLVASLPDGWITPLIERFAGDARFRHVAVNREESAIGLCSGAFFGGIGAFALMGASGFLTCIYALTKINYTYQVPLLIGITMRGAFGDAAKFHQSNGLYLEPVMRAIDIPYMVVDRGNAIPRLATAYRHSRVISRPVVVGFTRDVLRGEA
jgi:sulfopyruvate decarboxylase subunit alpha